MPLIYLLLFFNWKLETSAEAESTVGAPLYPSPTSVIINLQSVLFHQDPLLLRSLD